MKQITITLSIAALLIAAVQPAAAAAALKPDEEVVFYPALGWRARGGWEVEMHGRVFEPGNGTLLYRLLEIDDQDLSAEERAIFRHRAGFFFDDNERGKEIKVTFSARTYTLPRSKANGHFEGRIRLPDVTVRAAAKCGRATFTFKPSGGATGTATGEVHLLERTGLSIVSDIDDTIKISNVRDRRELIRNTFCRPFEAAPGMAALYQSWRTNADAQFHYVSASPWQLYQPLTEFMVGAGFPSGTFHLKQFRLKDDSFWELLKSPERYKPDVIEAMLKRFPERTFILVGDSGEKDPEIYGALARRHKKQIVRICIRDVTGEPEVPRYREAFEGLPRERWVIFKDPAELLRMEF